MCNTACASKPKKLCKKVLTKGDESAIICELRNDGPPSGFVRNSETEHIAKKVEKTFEKPLDKCERV